MKKFAFLLGCVLALGFSMHAGISPVDLRCDYAVNPLGVDSQPPHLFWKLAGTGQQSAYQIAVASSEKNLAQPDLWDSGKILSDESLQVPFAGKELNSSQQVFWKVRVWDAAGKVSGWSKTARWTMGILNSNSWNAKWIGAADTNIPSLLLRHEFSVKPGLKRAIVHVCGLGQYELTLNGKKVGDDFLSPGWTKYDHTCLYDTYDITAQLQRGKNAAGLELGNGMYNVLPGRYTKFTGSFGPQKAIAQLRLEYVDGSVEIIGTDESWRVAAGPIVFCSIYGGEDFDARREQSGWNKINFDDAKWSSAMAVNGPGGELRGLSAAAPPVHFFEVHTAVATRTLTNGDMVFDLGQNAAHVPKISVSGAAGSKFVLIPGELVKANGSVDQVSMNASRNNVRCEFTKATDGVETWSPKFFYIGCRYVQVHFVPAKPDGKNLPRVKSLQGLVINSASEPAGDFACSNDLFNRIRRLVRWAQRSNMVSLMTDCPHRERMGWLEEDHLNGPALRYEFDLAQLFTKTMNDIADSQLTNGLVPTTAPEYTVFGKDATHLRGIFGDSPEWSSTFILVPWQQYEFSGDRALLRTHYEAMKNYVSYLGTRANNGIVNYGLGDWYDIGPRPPGVSQLTPIALTATAFYFQDVQILAQTAALLGKEDDAKKYSKLAEKIRGAFNDRFYNATNHFYASGSQTACSIPLVMGICEESNRAGVVESIVRDVQKRGNALTAGDVGYRYLLRALADGGRSDVIFDINNQSDKPGYGMQLKRGATSLTEAWDGLRSSSQNHFMLGQIQEWFYHDLAGIQNAPGSSGFKHIVIAPQPVGDVKWTKASYNSIRGRITSDWKRDGRKFTLKISIPANTSATVIMPGKNGKTFETRPGEHVFESQI